MYHVSWSTLLPILVILRLFVVDLWAVGHGRASVGRARRRCYRSIGQQQPLLLRRRNRKKMTNNCFFWRYKFRSRKRFSQIGLNCNVAVPLVQIDTEMGEKYAKQQQPAVCGKFAFERYSAGCVSALMGLVS